MRNYWPGFPQTREMSFPFWPALHRIGVEVKAPSPNNVTTWWLEDIKVAIKESDFVVADVTESNPNVLIEVGIAFAVDKPVILLVNRRTHTRMPSDLAGYVYLAYDPDRMEELSSEFERVARRYADAQGAR